MRTAAAPFSACGWCTVVSGGELVSAATVSSKPTTERSSGHPQPELGGGVDDGNGHLVAHRQHAGRAVGPDEDAAGDGGGLGAVVGAALDLDDRARVDAGVGDRRAVAGAGGARCRC